MDSSCCGAQRFNQATTPNLFPVRSRLAGGAIRCRPTYSPRRAGARLLSGTLPSPHETASLGQHVTACKAHGKFFALQCGALAVHGFAASRFVTILVIASVLIGISVLVL
jgi:hypothetical protein